MQIYDDSFSSIFWLFLQVAVDWLTDHQKGSRMSQVPTKYISQQARDSIKPGSQFLSVIFSHSGMKKKEKSSGLLWVRFCWHWHHLRLCSNFVSVVMTRKIKEAAENGAVLLSLSIFCQLNFCLQSIFSFPPVKIFIGNYGLGKASNRICCISSMRGGANSQWRANCKFANLKKDEFSLNFILFLPENFESWNNFKWSFLNCQEKLSLLFISCFRAHHSFITQEFLQ